MNVKREIKSECFRVQSEVDVILKQTFGKALWSVNQMDALRLLRLKVWEEKYSVSLEYILKTLLPWAWSRLPKHIAKKVQTSKGLGTRIVVITSNAALHHLKEKIQEDFPDNENITSAKEARRQSILANLDEDELPSRPKKILQYHSIKQYVQSYADKIARKKKAIGKAEKKLARLHWRGNPFN